MTKISAADLHKGHRSRLRLRLQDLKINNTLPDYELLELLLFRSIPRKDTKQLAKALLQRFGSLNDVFNAPISEITKVDGCGEAVALDIKLVKVILDALNKSSMLQRNLLNSYEAVENYCRSLFGFAKKELFYGIFLDHHHYLISTELLQQGSIDHVIISAREIVALALSLNASGIILVHNHPSGDPNPSLADIETTEKIVQATQIVDIKILDHLIVARDKVFSFYKNGLIKPAI